MTGYGLQRNPLIFKALCLRRPLRALLACPFAFFAGAILPGASVQDGVDNPVEIRDNNFRLSLRI